MLRNLLIAVVVLVCGLTSLMWATGWSFLGQSLDTNTPTPAQLNACEQMMQVTFPSDTQALGLRMEVWQETHIWLKVTIPKSDLDTFLANSPFATVSLRTDQRSVTSFGGSRWWNPESVQLYRSTEVTIQGGMEGLRILIDDSHADQATIYLEWNDM